MPESSQIPSQNAPDIRQLGRAVRFALVAIVLGLSYFGIRASLSIENFHQIFTDMIGGKPLPPLTTFVINARPGFMFVSFIVPLVAFGMLFVRNLVISIYVIGVLALVTLIQFIVLYHALSAPFIQIATNMSGGTVQ